MRFHHFCCSRVAFEIQRNFILVPQVSSKVHFPFTEDRKFYWSIYDSWWQHQMSVCALRHEKWAVWKFRALSASFSFLSSPPSVPTLLLASFFALSLTLDPSSLLQSSTEMLTKQARPWATSSPQNSLSSPTHPPVCDKCGLYDWQVNEVNIVVEFSNRFPNPKLDF